MAKKKKTPKPIVKIFVVPDWKVKLHETKRDEHYVMYLIKMFFQTFEQCQWTDIVLPKDSKLYKVVKKKGRLPRMVFMAKHDDKVFPIQIGRSASFRTSAQISYGDWKNCIIVSVTYEPITPLDYCELVEKNP